MVQKGMLPVGGQSEKGEMRGLDLEEGRLQPLKEEEWRAAHIYIYLDRLGYPLNSPLQLARGYRFINLFCSRDRYSQ